MPRRAIVVGCGIGGPVAALALQRAGIQTTVFEAHTRGPETRGQCLNLTANGLDVLHTLGLDAIHTADGVQVPRLVLWSSDGHRLGELPNGLKLRDGTVSIVVQRSSLERTLRAEAARAGADIQTGRRVTSFDV